jgi:flagellin-specific chaperone FliS
MTDKPTKWASSKADAAWKVMICARDAMRAEDIIQGLSYILDNPGGVALEQHADVIRRFSGDQIADALLEYRNTRMQSVASVLNGVDK